MKLRARILFFLVSLAGALPLGLRITLGQLLGAIFYLIPTRERTIASLQMRLCLGDRFKPRMVRAMYAGLGQTVLESLNLTPMLSRAENHVNCPNRDELAQTASSGRGALFLSAHTANWDLLAAYGIRLGFRLMSIGREARSPILQELLAKMRRSYGGETLWRGGISGYRAVITALQDNFSLAALIDQDTRVKSLPSLFFGRPARTPSALIAMAIDLEVPIYSAFIFRDRPGRYSLYVEKITSSAGAQDVIDQYNRRLEELIVKYPEQWVWFHKRWKSRPDGSTIPSSQYIEMLTRDINARAA